MFPSNKNYILGKGKLFFAQFSPGTRTIADGQRYFGNSPSFNTTSESESLDHFDADGGIRVKDDSVPLELNRSGAFTVDHISPDNLALWFLGTTSLVTQAAITTSTQVIANAKLGRRYQIGRSPSNPSGVRGLSTVSAANTTTPGPLVEGVDFAVNKDTGGFEILPTATAVDAAGTDSVTVTYSAPLVSYHQVKSGSDSVIEGELFFEATNPKGTRFDYLFPFVQIKPDGDFELKGEEWQTISFTFEALKLNDTTESVYTNGRAGVYVT